MAPQMAKTSDIIKRQVYISNPVDGLERGGYYILKVRLWVLMRDQSLTHLCIDILLIPLHIVDHDISLKS